MEDLLFISHRIPYPPNKGDKILSCNILKHLSRDYRVHLGAFVDDPDDWRHEAAVRDLCRGEVFLTPLKPLPARIKCLSAFAGGMPLSVPYYQSRAMKNWAQSVIARDGIRRALLFSSVTWQFVEDYPDMRRVVYFVDVDSDKWKQYAGKKKWPLNRVYHREGETLLRYERRAAREADYSVFVSEREADLFRGLAPESADKVTNVNHGIDRVYYDPDLDFPSPYDGRRVLVFTGAMDYWANVDAIVWFAQEVFPKVRERLDDVWLYVVGARPAPAVRRLDQEERVCVTGAVPDIRPYLAHARAAIAPLRIARGVQTKLLEALAMAKPVLATPAAWEGIKPFAGQDRLTAEAPADLADKAVALLTDGAAELGRDGRAFVLANYDWTANVARLRRLLEGAHPGAAAPSTATQD